MAQFKVAVTDPTIRGIKQRGTIAEVSKYRVDVDAVDKYVGIKLEGCLTGEDDDQVILIEHYDGEWVIRIWSDCDSSDPTHRIVMKKSGKAG